MISAFLRDERHAKMKKKIRFKENKMTAAYALNGCLALSRAHTHLQLRVGILIS